MDFVIPSKLNNLLGDELHLLPCKIQCKREANVENYFRPYNAEQKDSDDNVILNCSFRGKPLIGKQIDIPCGYKGVFCEITKDSSEEKESLIAKSSCEQLTYWNWDKQPSKEDSFLSALDWISVSEALNA
ncbi:uncharacterized protein LOC126898518 [Daktulosphaira vitifoliae]|uniref:uncharacterized protein LOC126898518 n=1 Tax=Daktulosphaira vitifoliae TaxID=58002 RepID=UPI0021A9E348|nr:uncharacterized protein LOC126898518 [Daktulosphaira vitifoliae]